MGINESDKSGDKLKRHNEYIIQQIKNTKEYMTFSRIKILHEELMKRESDEEKKRIYERQYNLARNIFTKRIEIYNQNWKKIGEEE
ncbi:MAG: hypothetical protein N3G74_02365 [Candidatus Micrarchaeota archaeon]|nr:hypothetical protein [Candidatus Micrarchaeota archaeon]